MKNQFKKIRIAFIAVLFVAISFNASQTEARRGCCSWHGGVCGCRCCDGTSLSAKCAPYYPNCSPVKPVVIPKTILPKNDIPIGTLIFLIAAGGFGYWFFKK